MPAEVAAQMESPKRRKQMAKGPPSGTVTPQKVAMQKSQVPPSPASTEKLGDGSVAGDDPVSDIALPVQTPKKRAAVAAPPRHRIVGKTPRGLAGRVAALVHARTVESAGELPGAALAECILQVTGPPSITRAATKARHLLRWLRLHARKGSAKVCGRTVTPEDVEEAEKLVGNVWSKKLMKLQRRKDKALAAKKLSKSKSSGVESLAQSLAESSMKSNATSSTRDTDRTHSSATLGEGEDEEKESDSEDDGPLSDLSGEEDVDSEVEYGEASKEGFVDFAGAPLVPDDGYKGDWQGSPKLGSSAFNTFAAAAMRKAGVATEAIPSAAAGAGCPPLQPHQDAVVFMMHPKSPVTRLLVDHPTGSGKTREMIEVLDNYFFDPRPKVPVFPKEPVCRNFYAEMLRWPSKYRDYFCCLRPHSAARAARTADWRSRRSHLWDISNLGEKELRAICREMREVLEMKGCFFMGRMRRIWRDDFKNRFPDEPLPAAPLRALRYTSAGGRHTMLREEDGLPASALFKIGFSREDPNVYSNKIVIMDEVHNLVRTQTLFAEQLTHLRALLFNAKGTVLAGFTGTPILNEPQEGRQLLDIIKGVAAPLGDAGFVSSFPMRPPSLFPRSLPEGVPDAVLTPKLRRQFVRKVVLQGESLQRYDRKRALNLPLRRLQRYCNLCVHFGAMHEGKSGSKARVLDDIEACAPKLHAIAKDVAADESKALVLVARHSGMEALLAHLRRLGEPEGGPKKFGVATMDELAAFNSKANLRGELYRVLVADSTQCGEGVSFFAVRRVMLADVPSSPSSFVQAVGRSIRMYGHSGLSEEEKTVTTSLYSAVLPRWLRSPLGAWAYRAQRFQEPLVAQSRARRLIRKLLKVGIHDLAELREKLVAFFPKQAEAVAAEAVAAAAAAEALAAAAAARAEAAGKPGVDNMDVDASPSGGSVDASPGSVGATPPPGGLGAFGALPISGGTEDPSSSAAPPTGCSPASSSSAFPDAVAAPSTPRTVRRNLSDPKTPKRGGAADDPLAPSPLKDRSVDADGSKQSAVKLPQPEVIKFLESIGLWEEAKNINNSINNSATRIQEKMLKKALAAQSSPSKRALARRASRELGGGGSSASLGRLTKPKVQQQHWMVRAFQWLLLEESVPALVEKMNLGNVTADELALKSLSEHSRAFVPALEELRREAIDREVLENLMRSCCGGSLLQKAAQAPESDGESSAREFAMSGASSAGEDDAPPPLVLPADWTMQRVRCGKGFIREYIDPSGKRYRTEAQARKAVDEQRRKSNMSNRLRERFEARFAARAAAIAAGEGAAGGEKRPLEAPAAPSGAAAA